jgi:transcriptional regulator with XRE-family HTH domain
VSHVGLLVKRETLAKAYTEQQAQRKRNVDKNVYTKKGDAACVVSGLWPERALSRESAGAAIRALRESRDLSLADLAAATGVSIMGLSFLERGARKPHKSTVQKVENGLGLPPGTYSRLLVAADPDAELARLVAAQPPPELPTRRTGPVVVDRHSDTDVLEGYAEAQLDALKSVIDRLPATTSNEYETYILSVIAQCVKAEMLAASSWRVAVNAGGDSTDRLMENLQSLEGTRRALLERMPTSLGARFDQACAQSSLPEAIIAALVGVGVDDIWDMRNRGAIPPGALPRVRAFTEALEPASHDGGEAP